MASSGIVSCLATLTTLTILTLVLWLDQDFIFRNFGDILGCVLLVILIKFAIVAAVMKSFGFSWEASTLAGACMAQVGRDALS